MSSIDTFPIKVGIECAICNQMQTLTVLNKEYQAWLNGTKVQDAFPDLTPAEREMFITKTCGKCWDKMFSPMDEFEDMYDPYDDPSIHDNLERS